MKKQYLILGLLLASFQFAQAQFTLEGEFRPRTELFGGGQSKTALDGSDAWLQTSVRAALMATYKTESYTYYMSFQEVFLHGDRTQINASGNGNFRVQEAWADLKLAESWSFKLGRQPLSYDDQRILGGLGWAQQARTHDVGILKHKSESFSLDAGYAVNTVGDNVYGSVKNFSYRNLAFIHANGKFGKFSLSGLLLNTIYQDDTTLNNNNGTPNDNTDDFNSWGDTKNSLITAGIHAKGNFGDFGLAANFYVQSGDRIGETEVKGALLYSLDATYKVADKVTLLAGFESIGGKTDDSAAFFPLYGTNHKFNGLMDRFYVGNHGNAGGLVDINFGAKFGLGKGWGLTAKFHTFSEETANISTSTENLGSEIDLVLAKGFKGFKLVTGYSQFFEPSYVTGAKDTQNWAWAMLIIKPKFLTGK